MPDSEVGTAEPLIILSGPLPIYYFHHPQNFVGLTINPMLLQTWSGTLMPQGLYAPRTPSCRNCALVQVVMRIEGFTSGSVKMPNNLL